MLISSLKMSSLVEDLVCVLLREKDAIDASTLHDDAAANIGRVCEAVLSESSCHSACASKLLDFGMFECLIFVATRQSSESAPGLTAVGESCLAAHSALALLYALTSHLSQSRGDLCERVAHAAVQLLRRSCEGPSTAGRPLYPLIKPISSARAPFLAALVRQGALQCLMSLLRLHQADCNAVVAVCQAFGLLAQSTLQVDTDGADRAPELIAAVAAGACELLVATLRTHLREQVCSVAVCSALAPLCYDPTGAAAALATGASQLLREMAQLHLDCAPVATMSLLAMSLLVATPALQREFLAAATDGGVAAAETVIAVLRRHVADSGVVVAASKLCFRLLLQRGDVAAAGPCATGTAALDAGLLPALKVALTRPRGEEEAVAAVLTTLLACCHFASRSGRLGILEGLDLRVVAALSRHGSHDSVLSHGLMVLAKLIDLPGAAAKLMDAGAWKFALEALKRMPQSSEAASAFLLLRGLAQQPLAADTLTAAGAVELCVDSLAHCSAAKGSLQPVCNGLQALAMLTENCRHFVLTQA